LTRYQTSLALDQVEYNGTAESDVSTFNIKYVESRESTDLSENKRDKKNSNEKLPERNIHLGTAAVGVLYSSFFFFFFFLDIFVFYMNFYFNYTALL
jgi:hypothetical protein